MDRTDQPVYSGVLVIGVQLTGGESMRNPAFDDYKIDGPTAFCSELVGNLNGKGMRRLAQVWRTASSLTVNLRPNIDTKFVTGTALQLFLAALLFTAAANAANLKSETAAAWDEYVGTAQAQLQQRIAPDGNFLWVLENPERAARVRAGEILVAPATEHMPKKVHGGLIHHWIGAMFLPDLTLDQVLDVTRNYDRYKDFYQPYVIDSKSVARDDANDRFSMQIMNKAFFLKSALDADYQATYARLDERRVYIVSRTTRVQEIEEYRRPGEHRMPEGEGRGYIWKLFSVARFEQRDAGVYLELEAMALSREIPVPARVLVDPIVRRVSRNSLLISLQQTERAVHGKPASSPSTTSSLEGTER
jgi:hypothetical protein